ncbi:MAG TPA: sterol desaturase family protein [Steroidobacteraceae bacterium]|nr:sterol desaturase family protein [Steroidobacteraceae bacterium]
MQLSKRAYYADFGIYAIIAAAMLVAAAALDDWRAFRQWLEAACVGAAFWTLIEYVLHRFVFHGMPLFIPLHGRHHEMPRAFIGTPTWMSLGVLTTAIFLPAWWGTSLNIASALTAGVALGFLWYGVLHHAMHHRRPRFIASHLTALALQRHMRHHYSPTPGNFGVTTQFWDQVFGTELPASRSAGARSSPGATSELASDQEG